MDVPGMSIPEPAPDGSEASVRHKAEQLWAQAQELLDRQIEYGKSIMCAAALTRLTFNENVSASNLLAQLEKDMGDTTK